MAEGFGAFGKMPSVGDFFRLNTPAGFVTVWDDWIQRAMLVAQSALGEGWDSHYMSAPIWRFSLSAGLAGPQKIIGVAMPSVDRVGRRFPLTLMTAIPFAGPVELEHFRGEKLFETLEDLALDTLEDEMTRDLLQQRLAGVQAPPSCSAAPLRAVGGSLVLAQDGDSGLLPALAAGLLQGRYIRPSIWSAVASGAQRLLICEGLPEGPNMQALFDLNAPVWNEAQPT